MHTVARGWHEVAREGTREQLGRRALDRASLALAPTLGLGSVAISARGPAKRRFALVTSPGWVRVRSHRPASVAPARRGTVGSWSRRSRARLIASLAAVVWPQGREWVGVTLTYPAEFPDAARAKADLRAFRARFERRWPGGLHAVWKLEFQRRGAAHFHVLLALPCEEEAFRAWASRTWWQIAGGGSLAHRRHGCKTVRLHSSAWQYLVGEFAGAKGHQERAPINVDRETGEISECWSGRWWGLWNLERDVREVEISEDEFFRLRRIIRRLLKSRKAPQKRGFQDRFAGAWALSRCPAWMLAEAIGGEVGRRPDVAAIAA